MRKDNRQDTPRYTITPSGDRWRVLDTKTGQPSALVYSKARAQRLADDGNAREEAVQQVNNGKFYTVRHSGQLQAVFFYGGKRGLTDVAARKLAEALSAALEKEGVRP